MVGDGRNQSITRCFLICSDFPCLFWLGLIFTAHHFANCLFPQAGQFCMRNACHSLFCLQNHYSIPVLGWTKTAKKVCAAAPGVLYSEDCKTYKIYGMEFLAPSFTSDAFITAKQLQPQLILLIRFLPAGFRHIDVFNAIRIHKVSSLLRNQTFACREKVPDSSLWRTTTL